MMYRNRTDQRFLDEGFGCSKKNGRIDNRPLFVTACFALVLLVNTEDGSRFTTFTVTDIKTNAK
jgi:hypothetical protein